MVAGKGDPFQSPREGSFLALRNELSEETHVLTEQETLLGRGTRAERSRVREPKGIALPRGSLSWVLRGWSESSGCFRSIILTRGPWWHTHRSAKMDSSKKDSARLARHRHWRLLTPFDLSRSLLVGGS